MKLNKAEKLAREVVAKHEAEKARAWMHDYPLRENDLSKLARFVLAVMPVVRAAENCLPDPGSRRYAVFADVKDHACSVCAPSNDFSNKTWRCARHELIHAIDQIRRALEDK